MIEVPSGSIYTWMYRMGLYLIPLEDIEREVRRAGKDIRKKDYDNYFNGVRNSYFKNGDTHNGNTPLVYTPPPATAFTVKSWDEYPMHPWAGLPEIDQRWVPIGENGKPLIQWSKGCLYRKQAEEFPGMVSLAETLKWTQMIVIDCDGDHGEKLDMKTIDFLWKYGSMTHKLDKPKLISEYNGYERTMDFRPASFHLTFKVDRVIPTMHFPECSMDIIGNKCNSLRYLKNKVSNGLQPLTMDATIWNDLVNYVKDRREI